MPCCTYIPDNEKNLPICNNAVAEWLASAREKTGIKIVVLERKFEFRRWFQRKERIEWRYEILWPLGHAEYQVVNFYRDGTDWTINLMVPAEMAVAYLIGVCSK